MPPSDRVIAALADGQHGVVARSQLLDLGLGEGAIQHRLDVGRVYRVQQGVYSVGTPTLTRYGHWMAAVLSCGPDAMLSHITAAALLELRPTQQRKIDVLVPGARRKSRANIRVHGSSCLSDEDRTVFNDIPVTSVAQTILDCASALDARQLVRVVEQAERLQVFDMRALDRLMERHPRAKGMPTLQEALADYREPPETRSELERRFYELIRQAGLPLPQCNVLVAGLLVDFYWPQFRLVVELDGRPYHTSPRAFETDRVRDTTLQRHGVRVMRVTGKRMTLEPMAVLDDLIALTRLAA